MLNFNINYINKLIMKEMDKDSKKVTLEPTTKEKLDSWCNAFNLGEMSMLEDVCDYLEENGHKAIVENLRNEFEKED